MVYIEYLAIDETKAQVIFQMFKPEQLPEERKIRGLMVEDIPALDEALGAPTLFVNPESKELWYEYQPIPEPPLYPLSHLG